MSSGIYKIENILTGKYYVGSAINIKKRWREHINKLRRGTHENDHLQKAFNKYGEDAFNFEVLEFALFPEDLVPLEQKYIDELNPEYNLCPTAGSSLGVKRSEEFKLKVSEANKGKHPSEETKRKLSESSKGKTLSEETKRKLSEAHKGNKSTLGKHWKVSEEGRKHMSEAQKGNKNALDKHPSKETKQKMSEARKKYWEKRRERKLC